MRTPFLAVKSLLGILALGSMLSLGAISSPHANALFHDNHPRQGAAPHGHGRFNSTSSNWSGYASTGTTYTDVKGSWVQPTATCSSRQTAYSSFWVGIDGDGTNSVEQLGTDSDCSRGTPTYYGWYEMYPAASVEISTSSYPVRPGDTLTAEVHYNGSHSYTLSMSSSRGWSFSTTKSTTASNGSAEWIAEAPSSNSGVLPLANFGTVNFSACTANGSAISSNPNVDAITMASGSTTKATTSGLNGSGNGFSVTWHHS
jgi:hypothetical protein